ncbi:MAG: hypothetical protein WC510_04075 [Candidatus Omnitrophota bacterium]
MPHNSVKQILHDRRISAAVFILFLFCNNIFWFSKDGYIQHGCYSVWHEENAFEYSDMIANDRLSAAEKLFKTMDFLKVSHFGYAFSAINFNLASLAVAFPIMAPLSGGHKLFLINIVLFLQFMLVLVATYIFGKVIFSEQIGIRSALILSFYPGMVGLSRKTNSALLVTFFVLISILIFLRWKYMPAVLRSVFLAFIFICGVLSGGLYLVFFIPLFCLHAGIVLLDPKLRARHILDAVIFLFLAAIFFGLYFDNNYAHVFLNLKDGFIEACKSLVFKSSNWVGSVADGRKELFLFASQDAFCPCTQTINAGININTFLFYIMEIMYYTSPLFFLLGALSLVWLLKDRALSFQTRLSFGVWFCVSYILLTLFHIKWGSFIVPLLPLFALSSGFFLERFLKQQQWKEYSIVTLGIITVLFYSYFSYSRRHYLENLEEGIIAHRPVKSNFIEAARHIAETIDYDNNSGLNYVPGIIIFDGESPRFRGMWVADMSMRMGHLIRVFLQKKYRVETFWRSSPDFLQAVTKNDYLIVITRQRLKGDLQYLFADTGAIKSVPEVQLKYESDLAQRAFISLLKILR